MPEAFNWRSTLSSLISATASQQDWAFDDTHEGEPLVSPWASIWSRVAPLLSPRRLVAVVMIVLVASYVGVAWNYAAFDVLVAAVVLTAALWTRDLRQWIGAAIGCGLMGVLVVIRGSILMSQGMPNIAIWGGLYFLLVGAIAGSLWAWNRRRQVAGDVEVITPMDRLDEFGFLAVLILISIAAAGYFGLAGAVLAVGGVVAWNLRGYRIATLSVLFVVWLVLLFNVSSRPTTYASLFLTAERVEAIAPGKSGLPAPWQGLIDQPVPRFTASGLAAFEFPLSEEVFLEQLEVAPQVVSADRPAYVVPVKSLPGTLPLVYWQAVDAREIVDGYEAEVVTDHHRQRLVYDRRTGVVHLTSLWSFRGEAAP